MKSSASCSWCHVMNGTDEQFCINCEHEAHKPRMECTCPKCREVRDGVISFLSTPEMSQELKDILDNLTESAMKLADQHSLKATLEKIQ